jgi:hypothetical protein
MNEQLANSGSEERESTEMAGGSGQGPAAENRPEERKTKQPFRRQYTVFGPVLTPEEIRDREAKAKQASIARPTGWRSSPSTALIPQDLLRRYLDAKNEEKRHKEKADRLREELLRLKGAGAKTEDGPLTLEVRESEQQRFSHATLRSLVGEKEYLELLSRVPAYTVKQVLVKEAAVGKKPETKIVPMSQKYQRPER